MLWSLGVRLKGRTRRIWRCVLLTSMMTIAVFTLSSQLELTVSLYQTHLTFSPEADVKPALHKILKETHLTFSLQEVIPALKKTNDIHLYESNIAKSTSVNNRNVSVNHGPLPFHFKYYINEVNACNSSTELLIFVISHSPKREARTIIRETWASKSSIGKYNIKVLFLFGTLLSRKNPIFVEREHKQYHDVILANFMDTYNNLTLKSLSMLNWVLTYCQNTKYLLKSDDDVYINIDVLMKRLQTENAERKFLIGHLQPVTPVIREGDAHEEYKKWILSKDEYADDFFPLYMQGGAYAMTSLAIPDLYAASVRVNYLKLEDVFVTGLCADLVGVERIMHPGWLNTSIACDLRYHAVSLGSLSPFKIRKLHTFLQNYSHICDY